MTINVPEKYLQDDVVCCLKGKSSEIIFICDEIYNPIGYTQAVIKQIVYGNMLVTPEEFLGNPGIHILYIASNDFSDETKLLYDSTCVFVYDVTSKHFRYGPMTTHDDTPFWIEEYNRIE